MNTPTFKLVWITYSPSVNQEGGVAYLYVSAKGKSVDTIKLNIQFTSKERDTAEPITWIGQISELITKAVPPTPNEKAHTKKAMPPKDSKQNFSLTILPATRSQAKAQIGRDLNSRYRLPFLSMKQEDGRDITKLMQLSTIDVRRGKLVLELSPTDF